MNAKELKTALKAQVRTFLLLTDSRWQRPEEIAEALNIEADENLVEDALNEIVNEDTLVNDGHRGILDREFSVIAIKGCYSYDSRVLEEVAVLE